MTLVAFGVPEEKFDEYHAKLMAKGIDVTPIINHDDSKYQISKELHPGVFVRSMYFMDPDGILLEFAAWTRAFSPEEAMAPGATAKDAEKVLAPV
jgi:catechol 2,3-dioxygenase-like lactoylglutathione lyase family enzyme